MWARIPGKASRDDDMVGAATGHEIRVRKEVNAALNSSRKSLTHRLWHIWGNF